MALPTALLVKGLAGVGAIGGVVGGGFLIKKLLQPKEPNEIIKDLGIEDTTCHFTGTNTTATCTLDTEKLKKIKFEGKTGDTVTANSSVSLTIEKLTGEDEKNISSGLLFTFKNTHTSNDLDIGTDSNKITLKANTSYDFKVTSDGTKLEKAWTLKSLGAKVGLNCNNEAGDDACECDTSDTQKINVWKSESNYLTGATGASGKKISVAKDTSNYKQGFKFEVKDSGDISLSGGTSHGTTIDKLTKNNTTYEIDLKDLGGDKGKKWFLVEKTTTGQ